MEKVNFWNKKLKLIIFLFLIYGFGFLAMPILVFATVNSPFKIIPLNLHIIFYEPLLKYSYPNGFLISAWKKNSDHWCEKFESCQIDAQTYQCSDGHDARCP